MTLCRLAVCLTLGSAAVAQRPALEVQDLVLPDTLASSFDPPEVVLRAFHGLSIATEEDDENRWTFHGVSGEGHLVRWTNTFAWDEPEPRGLYTEDSLAAVLAALRGTSRSGISFQRSGDTVLLDTEYPEQLAGALATVRRALPPRIRLEVTLERLSGGSAEVVLRGSETFRNGTVRVLSDVAKKEILRDFDVEIAQSASTANPIVGEVRHGASVALRARPLPFRDEAVVEAVVRTASLLPTEPLQPHPAIGPLDRAASRVDEGGITFRIGRGQSTRHEWTTLDGTRMRLTCAASWAAPEPVAEDAESVLVASSLLGPPVLGFRSATHFGFDEPLDATSVPEIVEEMRSEVGRDSIPVFEPGEFGGGGVLLLSGSGGRRFQRMLDDRLERVFRSTHVRLEILDVPSSTEVAADGPLPDGARGIGSLAGPLLVGHPICFASAREQSYVRDWEVEVAQGARIPDPKISLVEDGWFGTVRVVPEPGGGIHTLEVDVQVRVLDELRALSTSLNWPMAAATDETRVPPMWMPQDVLTVELPDERELAIRAVLELGEDGTALLRRSATTLLGPGRALVVRARVE